ncbi:hypothetical protein BLJAPNOD_06143 [Ensifer sp. M14]|nr:hypothetical protein BLJAPNOD_06143 [Ensifer sp. M14]
MPKGAVVWQYDRVEPIDRTQRSDLIERSLIHGDQIYSSVISIAPEHTVEDESASRYISGYFLRSDCRERRDRALENNAARRRTDFNHLTCANVIHCNGCRNCCNQAGVRTDGFQAETRSKEVHSSLPNGTVVKLDEYSSRYGTPDASARHQATFARCQFRLLRSRGTLHRQVRQRLLRRNASCQ